MGDFKLACVDAIGWLCGLPSDSADLVVTDPPYESLEKHRAKGTTTRLKRSKASSNVWFPVFPNVRFTELFFELYRVLKKDSHLYVFSDAETMGVMKSAGESAGFKFWKPLVWDKVYIGMGYHYRARYEFILFFEKGKRKLASLSVPDILREPRIRTSYPTEKPVGLLKVLVQQSSVEGETICDPFMGSGACGESAISLGRKFLGNDIRREALVLTERRLKNL